MLNLFYIGLGDSLSQHVPQFMAHSISGSDLLKLSRPQLEYLKVSESFSTINSTCVCVCEYVSMIRIYTI